jgi:DNA end-binding protein Ku
MARAIWTGTISFGLVTIPVELRPAVRENRPRFRLLHEKDLSPVEYRRVCQKDGKAIAWEDIVKGYEFEPGRFVVLTKDDFETAALEKSRTVHVLDFVKQAEIDDRFYDVPYYVLPSKGGEPAYAVLREALRAEDKVGVSRVMLRQVQHLAALGVVGDMLVLTLMRFADELVDLGEFHVPTKRDVRPKELQLARTLVDNLTSKWDPEQYKDDYNENLMRVIKSKMRGTAPRLKSSDAQVPANVVDLMARLKESLAQRSPARSTKRRPAAARGRKRTKKVA